MSSDQRGSPPVRVPPLADLTVVGRGGFSVVYSATDPILQRRVALKVLLMSPADHPRFERECRVLALPSDVPGVVPVLQATYASDGRPCIVMSMLDGGSLADRLIRSGALPPSEVQAHGIRLATALAAAHGLGVVHRDIKPENVLFSGSGNVALADFGSAVVAEAVASTMTVSSFSTSATLLSVAHRDEIVASQTDATVIRGIRDQCRLNRWVTQAATPLTTARPSWPASNRTLRCKGVMSTSRHDPSRSRSSAPLFRRETMSTTTHSWPRWHSRELLAERTPATLTCARISHRWTVVICTTTVSPVERRESG